MRAGWVRYTHLRRSSSRPLFASLRDAQRVILLCEAKEEKMPSKKIRRYTYLTEEEDRFISAQAKLAGMSVSMFLRRVGTGVVPLKRMDMEACSHFLKAMGDLNKLGNLYKLELSNDERFYNNESYRKKLLEIHNEIIDLKNKTSTILDKVIKK